MAEEQTQGQAQTRDNYGQNIGANTGTAQQLTIADAARIYGPTVGINLGTIIYGSSPLEDSQRKRLLRYLERLACTLDQVSLRGLEQRKAQQQDNLALPKVYTLLATTERVQVARGTPDELEAYLDGEKPRKEYDPDYTLPDQAIVAVEHSQTGAERRTLWRALVAAEAVARHRCLVLTGSPGGGKSTFLRHLGWLVAQHTLETLSASDAAMLPAKLHTLLPVVLPLPRLARALAQEKKKNPDTAPAAVVTNALIASMRDYETGDLSDRLSDALSHGAVLVLLDGLDEVPTEPQPGERATRVETLEAVQAFARQNRQARVVVTCRTRAFEPLQAALPNDWHTATLAPFTMGQIRYFVDVWYDELAAQVPAEAAQVAKLKQMLVEEIEARPRLCEMAATPLLLTMMALVLYNKGELPRDRLRLYEAILELLLGQWDRVRDGQSLADVVGRRDWTAERLRPVLDKLSYEAHRDATSEDGRGRLSRMAVEWALRQHLVLAGMPDDEAAQAAARAARYMEQRSGLLLPAADDYEFAHLTLQEHCAGRHMVRQSNPLALIMEHRGEDRWREPIFLGLGTIQEGNPWLIESVLRRLIQRNPQVPVSRWYRDLILAAELGEDRDWAYLQGQGLDVASLQRDLRAGLAALLNDAAQPLPTAERIRAGFLLGSLGDPRYPVTVEEWQRELARIAAGDRSGYFCKVEAGTYTIGSNDDDLDARDDEKPQHTVTFGYPFWVARYPLTNAQWQAWVDAGGTQSYFADRSDLNHPNQPVVGISWHMCNEFCAWLSEKMGMDVVVRLPTEAEWEAAARGGDARIYPWGNEWHADRAATKEDKETRGGDRSAPVGCYPGGAAACGALDMAGNVWEWTADVWKSHPGAAKAFEDKNLRTIKGGGGTSCIEHLFATRRGTGIFPPPATSAVCGCVSPLAGHSR